MALSESDRTPANPGGDFQRLRRLLGRARSRAKVLILADALLRTAVIVLAAVALLFLADNIIHLPALVRLPLALAIPMAAVVYFVRRARDAFGRWRDDRVAVRLEGACPELENRLINAVQLGRSTSDVRMTRVIERIVSEAAEQGAAHSLDRAVSWRPLRPWAVALGAGLLVILVYRFGFPQQFENAAARFLRPASDVLPVTAAALSIEPGDVELARGASVEILATPTKSIPQQAEIRFRQQGQTTALDMVFDGSIFVHPIHEVQEPMKYQVRAGDFRSHWYKIEVAERPDITQFQITYRYPAYTQLPPSSHFSSQGHVRAVLGSEVEIEAWANREIASSRVLDDRDRAIAAEVEPSAEPPGGGAKRGCVRFRLPVERDGAYRIVVTDEKNFSNDPAPVFTVKAIPDVRPSILVQSPRREIDVPQGRNIPVLYVASDDYGIATVRGVLARGDGTDRRYVEERAFSTPTLRLEDGFQLPLERYRIGDELQLTLIAGDANPVARGMTVSDPVRIRIVDPNKVADSEMERFDAMEGRLADAREDRDNATTEPAATVVDERLTTRTDIAEKLKTLHDDLEEFLEVQRRVIRTSEDLAKIPPEEMTDEQLGELKNVADLEDDWAKYFKEAATDLSRVPETEAVDSALVDELNEIYSEIKKVADELKPENIEIYVPVEQAGVELAEALQNRMEEWLSDTGDFIKWNMEEPPAPIDVPLAELPSELEDLMGDLVDMEEDMTDAVEDVSSSWADSMSDAGWDVADGPISNFSAVGKTGNTLPNDTEISGRSGEGRTGRSHGEFVEKAAVGKGGRDTPTRLTPDTFEEGIVQDQSTEGTGGSTGGGKRAGFGGRGLTGPTPPITQDMGRRLAGRQADIREKAQQLSGLLKRYQLPAARLDEAIGQMRQIETMAGAYRYEGIERIHKVKIENLQQNETFVREKIRLEQERRDAIPPRVRHQITQGLQEEFPEGYEELIRQYYENLADTSPN